jgi:hypothetical protein
MPRAPTKAEQRRTTLRQEHWPNEVPWKGPDEIGFFAGPRTLPYLLLALRRKAVSGEKDPSSVYTDLLSHHMGQGVVELLHEEDHAYAAGYHSTRTWRDRMKVLEDAGFIRATTTGNRKYAKVFLIHPALAMQRLREAGKIPDDLWQAYRNRAIEVKEATVAQLTPAPLSIQ